MKRILVMTFFAFFIILTMNAQDQITIIGIVKDNSTNEPLIGASILEKGTSNGVITNFKGEFSIKIKNNSKILVSYLGYKSQELLPSSGKNEIKLVENTNNLNDVIVVGYGVQKKSDITGAISSISGKDISSAPVSSAVQAMQGKAAGVQIIQNSGSPGSPTTIKIRGTGTVNNSDPLYVVDGFIVDNIDNINANDIANVEILKDAASSSIYGARSANGVVLISTKNGKSGKISINFDTYAGISNPWKEIKVMGADDYALMSDYISGKTNYSANGKLYYSQDPVSGAVSYDNSKFQRLDSLKRNSPGSWWNAITQTGVKQQYNLSVSGGNEANMYMISGNYYKEEGIIKSSNYNRFTTRANLTNKLTKWLTLQSNFYYTNDSRSIIPEGQNSVLKEALYQNPLVFTYNTAGYFSENHPIAIIARNHNQATNNQINLNINLTANIGKNLTYQFKVSDYSNFYDQKIFNEVQKLDANFIMPTDLTNITKNDTYLNKLEINNLITYNWKKKDNELNVLLGQTAEIYNSNIETAYKAGTASNSDNLWYLSSGYTGAVVSEIPTGWSAMGFLGRLNYTYLDRYLLQLNFRTDASSKFSPSERWGYFPAFSLGWKFSRESFLKNVSWLSLGKIRVGWGQLGNNRIDDNATNTLIYNQYNYSFGAGTHVIYPGSASTSIGNTNIHWEKTETSNFGIDLNFFDNKLTTTIEYFNRLTTDMLLRVPVVVSAGLPSAPMVNAGSVSNGGIELNLNYRGSIDKFKFEIGFNTSYIKNIVTNLGNGNAPVYGAYLTENSILNYVTKTAVGHPIGSFYGYVTDGIFNNMDEITHSAQNDGATKPGDFRFKDLNSDGKITADDRTYLGSPSPDLVFGIPISFSYKNFDLSIFIQGQTGNKIFNVMEYYLNSGLNGNVYANLRSLQWSGGVGDRAFFPQNFNGSVPDLDLSDLPDNFRASNFYVKDGSYARVKNVMLNYNFTESVCKALKLSNFSVFIGVYNLFTFTKYDGLDPEIGKNVGSEGNNLYLGVDHGNFPQARTITTGLKIGL
ncbi:MAG: TonB-dependent receptor [Paludibacter sp.]|nr:TonB-dependent receptor [Paludibacter sp.]